MAHQELELERQRAEGLSFALEELRRERDQLTLKLREIQALNPVQETQKEETKISETLENLEMKEDISEKEEKVLNDTLKQSKPSDWGVISLTVFTKSLDAKKTLRAFLILCQRLKILTRCP